MRIGPSLILTSRQTLAMTPQLQQAIKLLQFSHLELAAFIQQELEKKAAEDSSTLVQLRSRAAKLAQLLSEQAPTILQMVEPPLVPNPNWGILQARVLKLGDDLDELSSRLGGTTADRDALRESIKRKIDRTTADLKAEPKFIKEAPVQQTVPNPEFKIGRASCRERV